MRHDRPLLLLAIAALASYPALTLSWCVAGLLGGEPTARELWWEGHPGALVAPVLVGIGAVAVLNSCHVLIRGLWNTHQIHRWLSARRVLPTPATPPELVATDRVRLIATPKPLAVTVGLVRPYVAISTGLLAELSDDEVRAVFAHERAHARRRDPLRLLLGRVLAAHLWFLPLAADMRGRARRGYELAADRHAATECGRAAVAGALLRVTAQPRTMPAFAAGFAESELLEARVAQLESGRAPRPAAVSPRRAALTAAGALGFVLTVAGAWTFMLVACTCLTGIGGA